MDRFPGGQQHASAARRLTRSEVIASIAAAQHGIVSRAQLLAAGVSEAAIGRRVRSGYLRVVHAGVYAVGPVAGASASEMAAALACDGVLSHRSAARLWGLSSTVEPGLVDVTQPAARRVRRAGVRLYRNRLANDEIARIALLPVTTCARTLVDLAAVASPRELEQALGVAERERKVTAAEVAELLARHGSRRGVPALRQLIDNARPVTFTRSEAEERLLRLIRSGGLPDPHMNVLVHGREVDCYWPRARLVVEVDGFAFHTSTRAFVSDRRRDSALAAAGIQVLRLSWQQLTTERDRTLVQLAQALARAGI